MARRRAFALAFVGGNPYFARMPLFLFEPNTRTSIRAFVVVALIELFLLGK